MPLNPDVSSALQLLEYIQSTIKESDDVKLQAQTTDDLNLLISMLENPIFRSIVQIQDSLGELNSQIQQHPSILPVDFDLNTAGELILNLPPPIFETEDLISTPNIPEVDDQRVPVAKLSASSSGEPNSPPTISVASMNETSLPPITTMTYALEFQKAVDESSEGRDVITVKLYKPEGCSLGFSVVGLRSEEKGELGIFIQEIQPNGIAGRDGRLHEGDQILAIDGQPLDSNISHPEAISILQKARGLVELIVARSEDVHPPSASPSPSPSAISETSKAGSDMVLNTEWAQVEVIDLVNDGSGLGFGIIGGRSTGVVVKTILPTGVADRDGRLQSGDHILQIGDVNLRGMGSEQVAAVLRQSGSEVRLVVARPVEPTSPDYQALGSHAPIVPTKILGDPEELDRHLIQNGYPQVTYNTTAPSIEPYDNPFIFHEDTDLELLDRQDPRTVVDIVPVTSLPLPFLTMDMLPLDTQLPEMERFTVELKKDIQGLGITIAGYVCEKEELSGIFVKSISAGSAADLCKKIQVNDRIVEVDGKSLQGYTNHDAVEVLRSTGGTVRLSLERYLRGPKFEQLQQAIANSELNKPPTPSSPSALSLPRFPVSADGESTEVEVEGESVTTVDSACLVEANNPDVDLNDLDDVDLLIDTDYEGPLKPTVEAAIKAKWSKIMGPEVEIVVGQLTKFGEGGGLGISLEGTVDVEDGQEVRPHHYIRSILAEGPVGQNGMLKSGDELLEVNGHRLLGMNHIEVVTILKELPKAVRMVCARRAGDGNALRLIDTSQDRAAFAARSLLGGSLQNLLPAMERLVKAKSDGSLASTTTAATEPSLSKLRSRSLEPITGLAMWSSEPHIIELVKGERGLGFSILDYQDPMNPSETVIVIRSLVPGGVAQMDGRLIPGDRLLSVNSVALDNASLDQAVQALKGAPKGIVRIAVAKPLPIPDSVSNSQAGETGLSQETPTLDDHSMYSCTGSSHSLADEIPLDENKSVGGSPKRSEDNVYQLRLTVPLPASLETEIVINNGNRNLGAHLERVNEGVNGMVVTDLASSGALANNGKIQVGDMITSINNESLRGIGEDHAKAILTRLQTLTSDISLRFIKKKLANDYLKTCHLRADRKKAQTPRSPRLGNELLSEIHNRFRSPILSPLGCESASDKESEYVDCDCIDDRTGVLSPVHAPVTLVRKLSASSYDIDNRYTQSEKNQVSEVIPKVPELASQPVVVATDKSPLSVDDSFSFTKQIDRTQVKNSIFPIRERSLESLNSKRSVNESVELTKGVSEPVLSCRTRKSAGREMTVTTNYSGSLLVAKHWGPQRSVQISRDPKNSLGISIVGGKVDLYNSGPESSTAISGIFIKNILPNSPAGRTAELKAGDRILEVDGVDLRQASHDYAVDVIRSTKTPVTFLVQSLVKWSTSGGSISACSSVKDISCDELKTQSLSEIDLISSSTEESTGENHLTQDVDEDVSDISNQAESLSTSDKPPPLSSASSASKTTPVKASEKTPMMTFSLVPPETKVVPSIDDDDEEEDSDEDDSYRDMEGRIRTAAGIEISRASAGNVKRSKEEAANDPEKEDYFGYTTNKVKKKYGNLGASLVIVEFEKTPNGLGISLAGHKDRNKMAVLICGLHPHGLASKSGALQVGDEILEVNGVVLHGRCHLNASAIMKGIAGPVYKIIALRKTDALQELSVKPITQFPLSIEEETPEQRYSSFKGVRTISMRKKT